jgi:hypothetical protein
MRTAETVLGVTGSVLNLFISLIMFGLISVGFFDGEWETLQIIFSLAVFFGSIQGIVVSMPGRLKKEAKRSGTGLILLGVISFMSSPLFHLLPAILLIIAGALCKRDLTEDKKAA